MSVEWSEQDLIKLENMRATPGMMEVGALLAQVVDDALRPALTNHRVNACEHVGIGTERQRQYAEPVAVERRAYLCPMHPEQLVCDEGSCIRDHYAAEHPDAFETAGCFVCETPVKDDLTGELRDDFTPVAAEIVLHQNVNVGYVDPKTGPLRLTNVSLAYGGFLLTLPVAYLCPRHSKAAGDLPWRAGWPMGDGEDRRWLPRARFPENPPPSPPAVEF